jgi:hypothetical protein
MPWAAYCPKLIILSAYMLKILSILVVMVQAVFGGHIRYFKHEENYSHITGEKCKKDTDCAAYPSEKCYDEFMCLPP